jgi:hypothetical protein
VSTTWPACLFLLDLVVLIICGRKYKLTSSCVQVPLVLCWKFQWPHRESNPRPSGL